MKPYSKRSLLAFMLFYFGLVLFMKCATHNSFQHTYMFGNVHSVESAVSEARSHDRMLTKQEVIGIVAHQDWGDFDAVVKGSETNWELQVRKHVSLGKNLLFAILPTTPDEPFVGTVVYGPTNDHLFVKSGDKVRLTFPSWINDAQNKPSQGNSQKLAP